MGTEDCILKEREKKKQMKHVKVIALLLLITTLMTFFAACSEKKTGDDKSNDSQSQSAQESDSETELPYEYPEDAYYDGETIRVMNVAPLWGAYTRFDCEDDGEGLNTEIYKRNRQVEDKLGVVFKEILFEDIWNYYSDLLKTISADSDEYDMVFMSETSVPTLISQNALIDLLEYPELQLDQPWWDQDMVKGLTINGKLFATTGALNMMASELTACLWFNWTVCENYQLDLPYDTVRDGKWTFDVLQNYCKTVANLNGQDTFDFDPEGAATYGLSTSWVPMSKFIYGFDMHYFEEDGDGDYNFIADDEKFISRLEAMSAFFGSKNGSCLYETDTADAFHENRIFAFTNEVKAAVQFREYDTVMGILPYPKYDEAQADYHSTISIGTTEFCIPVTCRDVERSAIVADMCAYYGYKDVMPVYYDNYLFIKGFRDKPDDVEMLQLINASRGVDTAVALRWIGNLHDWDQLPLKIGKGDTGFASLIESKRDQFINNMDDMLDEIYFD